MYGPNRVRTCTLAVVQSPPVSTAPHAMLRNMNMEFRCALRRHVAFYDDRGGSHRGFIVGVDSHPDGPTVDVDCGDMVWRHVPAGRPRPGCARRTTRAGPNRDAHVGDVEQHVRGVVVVDPVGPVAAGRARIRVPLRFQETPQVGGVRVRAAGQTAEVVDPAEERHTVGVQAERGREPAHEDGHAPTVGGAIQVEHDCDSTRSPRNSG